MKRLMGLSLLMVGWMLTACSNQLAEKAAETKDSATSMTADSTSTKTFVASSVDNKKDPTCGMPVAAGIYDTAHYDNHVIGFCSTECKNEFLKNPKAGLAAAELK